MHFLSIILAIFYIILRKKRRGEEEGGRVGGVIYGVCFVFTEKRGMLLTISILIQNKINSIASRR